MSSKSFKDISWLVTEEEYRADPALSYSTIAKYERSGFNQLEHLFDKIETLSLTHGSAVDSIITGGQEEFNERFMVSEFSSCSDNIKKIVNRIFYSYTEEDRPINLEDVDEDAILRAVNEYEFYPNWKASTRVNKVKTDGSEYYNLLFLAGDRKILSTSEYQDVVNSVNALRDSKATEWYFAPNNPFENIERFYQLKFKATFNGVNYRCMADLIIVDYEKKIIYPVDLKTSSHTEWDFYRSFVDWRYDIQARLYWRIIRDNMDRDPYFKDFILADYKFIVVNKRTLTPLVWDCPFTQAEGTLTFGKFNQIEMRHPFVIGEELAYYLSSRPKVPKEINLNCKNNLENWLNKL